MKNPEIVSAFSYAKEHGKNIHFMGLTSNGGVHSSFDHLFKLCDISKEYGIDNTFIQLLRIGWPALALSVAAIITEEVLTREYV